MDFVIKLYHEIGLATLISASRDVHLLCAQRFVRLFAYGQVTIILAVFFTELNLGEEKTGLFMTCTLLGDVVISFLLTLVADQVGRRNVLGVGAILMCLSGITFSYASTFWILLVAAIVGVISPKCVSAVAFAIVCVATNFSIVETKSGPSEQSKSLHWRT